MLPSGPIATFCKLGAFDYRTASSRRAKVTYVIAPAGRVTTLHGLTVAGGFKPRDETRERASWRFRATEVAW